MSFTYTADNHLEPNVEQNRRTAKPGINDTFEFWQLASPAPAYLGCVIRIVAVTDQDHVQVAIFDPGAGTEMNLPALAVNLQDWTQVWRGLPSSIDLPAPIVANQFALLFLHEAWLQSQSPQAYQAVTANPAVLMKFPLGADGLFIATIRELIAALQKNGINPIGDPVSFPDLHGTVGLLPPNSLGPMLPGPISPDPISPDPISPDPISPGPISPGPISPGPISPALIAAPAASAPGAAKPHKPAKGEKPHEPQPGAGAAMNKVLIIGKHKAGIPPLLGVVDEPSDHALDTVTRASASPGSVSIYQCNGAEELCMTLRRFVAEHGFIDILEIADHGVPGAMLCGDEILVQHDGHVLQHGGKLAADLVPLLTETAQVHLLGCKTALDVPGRCLLRSIAQRIGGHRTVFGTLDRVDGADFSAQTGFLLEREMLYSSLAALDAPAPDQTTRDNALIADNTQIKLEAEADAEAKTKPAA